MRAMVRAVISLAVLLFVAVLPRPVHAADPINIQIMALEEEPGRMVLTLSAVDQNGRPFPSLDPTNFNAWINDTALIIRELHTDTARLPASVLLLVDVSGSMAGEPMDQARTAIQQFIDTLEPNDQVALMTFSATVSLLQDFTADRSLLTQAVSHLTPQGATALYEGVFEAAARMRDAPEGRKLVVLLSDGVATSSLDRRPGSIQVARETGVGFVAVGLGNEIDRGYLSELTSASGGRFIEAPTPAALRQAYIDIAFAIRSQYALHIEVPRSVDRTVPGTLKVHVIRRADNAFAERHLEALAGASPPPFRMTVAGLAPGARLSGNASLLAAVEEGIEVVRLEYYVDGVLLHAFETADAGFELDGSLLEPGAHVLKVVATDVLGREGEVQVPFLVTDPAAAGGLNLPVMPLAVALMLACIAYLFYRFAGRELIRRLQTVDGAVSESRVAGWASVRAAPAAVAGPVEAPAEATEHEPPPPALPRRDPLRGRLVVMDEQAVRNGDLDSIREFELRSLPLKFGSGPSVDVRVGAAGGLIAAEEARIWVQRGRLIFHKLTTLSAMATDGVTPGWQFLDDGEEMRIGPYRLIFQLQREEEPESPGAERWDLSDGLPQEHGMSLRQSGPARGASATPDLVSWATGGHAPRPDEPEPPEHPLLHPVGSDDAYAAPGQLEGPEEDAPGSAYGWSSEPPVSGETATQWRWDGPMPEARTPYDPTRPEASDASSWDAAPDEGGTQADATPEPQALPHIGPQPEAWNTFVSGGDDDAWQSAGWDSDDADEDPPARAWGA